MTFDEREERARAETLGWAQEAADRGDLSEAIDWVYVAELTHGPLPEAWDRTRSVWTRVLERRTAPQAASG
jgi:hypothetical protein